MFLLINIKVCLIGDGAVGKTALRENYLGRGFTTNYLMTMGADFAIKQIKIKDYDIKFQIWDLAGQSHFSRVRSLYYKGSRGFLLVFDLTRLDSFENSLNWIDELIKNVKNIENLPFVLIGNKADLRDESDPTHLNKSKGHELSQLISQKINNKRMPVPYFETSAKTGKNVLKAFNELGNLIITFA